MLPSRPLQEQAGPRRRRPRAGPDPRSSLGGSWAIGVVTLAVLFLICAAVLFVATARSSGDRITVVWRPHLPYLTVAGLMVSG